MTLVVGVTVREITAIAKTRTAIAVATDLLRCFLVRSRCRNSRVFLEKTDSNHM